MSKEIELFKVKLMWNKNIETLSVRELGGGIIAPFILCTKYANKK